MESDKKLASADKRALLDTIKVFLCPVTLV